MLPSLASFSDELAKIAGVGWSLHGYSATPEELAKRTAAAEEASDVYQKKMDATLGKMPSYMVESKPGFFSRLFGAKPERTKNPAWGSYWEKARAYHQKHRPPPSDDWEVGRAARLKTPYDAATNYKLNMHMDYNRKGGGALQQYVTDQAYADEENQVVRNLSRGDLKKVVAAYRQAMADYKVPTTDRAGNPLSPEVQEAERARVLKEQQAFLSKAQHLMKDPTFRFARLEME